MNKMKGILCLVGLFSSGCIWSSSNELVLGPIPGVSQLYSYPNNCNEICFEAMSLEQTVAHYLDQSLQRDGYAGQVQVRLEDGLVKVRFPDAVPADYGARVMAFLEEGQAGLAAAHQLNDQHLWAYNWRFFLPHGMALENHRSVELLHFPPDDSLMQAQDYLKSKTTDRWAALLTLNGVPPEQTSAYQTIVDLAPVAAPANAGSKLSPTYTAFTPYVKGMIHQWSQTKQSAQSYPMVAFGQPVRQWLAQAYGQQFQYAGAATGKAFATLDLGALDVGGRSVAVLGANHPSQIWYAADPDEYGGDSVKADKIGIQVMGQDLVAACWQAGMGDNPAMDPAGELQQCQQRWPSGSAAVCEQFYQSIRRLNPSEAAERCQSAS
ncbi:hypothetical protein ABHF91_13110 [Pseudaeromonas sp. ZJS20]|uniref:hypothetical protein n=1 Tax=Pseudaeromonas aegiceratis TaxID=3153928 RepID=UPI00390C86E3